MSVQVSTAQVYRSVGERSTSQWQTQLALKIIPASHWSPWGEAHLWEGCGFWKCSVQEGTLQAGLGEVLFLQTYCCVPRVDCCGIVSLHDRTNIFLFCNSRASEKKKQPPPNKASEGKYKTAPRILSKTRKILPKLLHYLWRFWTETHDSKKIKFTVRGGGWLLVLRYRHWILKTVHAEMVQCC